MSIINKILFPSTPGNLYISTLLFAARIVFGITFMTHGFQKWLQLDELLPVFPDPLGLGSNVSLTLALFAELICPLGVIFGFLYRLALIPMIFTMLMAILVIHGADPFAVKELAFLYLVIFILLLVTGPGRISLDSLIGRAINKRNRNAYSAYSGSGLNYSR